MNINEKLELISDKAGFPRHGHGLRTDLISQLLGVSQRTLNRYKSGDFVPESVEILVDLLSDAGAKKVKAIRNKLNIEV